MSRFQDRLQMLARRLGAPAVALALSGCTVHTAGPPIHARAQIEWQEPVVFVQAPPPHLHVHSSVVYRGRRAYLARDGRWYSNTPRGWAYYREEPRELRRYRAHKQRERRRERRGREHTREYRADRDERWSYSR